MGRGGVVELRCPEPSCGAPLQVPDSRLGRNVTCPACGWRFTARRHASPEPNSAQPARLPLAVLVDNVRSLWNVGSIFRTADACGVERLVLAGITGHPPRPEITKTALGAEETVFWLHRSDPVQALAELAAQGYEPVALEAGPGALSLETVAWPSRPCLVVGNEVAGITPAVLAGCPMQAAIPMRGSKSSLNVAVAFGIAAYAAASALARRRGAARSGTR